MPYIYTDDINLLILQYLRESGFTHSSFTFAYESGIDSLSDTTKVHIKLVELLQKGMYFNEIEKIVDSINPKRISEDIATVNDISGESLAIIISEIQKTFKTDVYSLKTNLLSSCVKNAATLPNLVTIKNDEIYILPVSLTPVNDFCFKPNGVLLTGHINGSSVCWMLEKKDFLGFKEKYHVDAISSARANEIIAVEEIPGTDNFCVGARNGCVRVINENGVVNMIQEFQSSVWIICAWSNPTRSSEPFVAFSSVDGVCTMRVGALLKSMKCKQTFNDCISDCSWSKSGILALSSIDGSLSFLDPHNDLPPIATNLHKGEIYSHKWSKVNEYLAVATYNSLTIYVKTNITAPSEIICHTSEISSIVWADDNEDILISADSDSHMFFHTFDSYYNRWKSESITLASFAILCCEVIRGQPYVVAACSDGYLVIVNYRKRQIYKSLKLDQDISQLKMSQNAILGVRFVSGQMALINMTKLIST